MVDLPEHVMEAVEEAQRLRGWIASGYAQVEYLLGDIIMRALEMPEYQNVGGRLPHGSPKRAERVRKILEVDGFYSNFAEEIESIIQAFELHHDLRNLLAHGFITVYHAADGDVGFQFRKWHCGDGDNDTEIVEMFQIVNLEYHKTQLEFVADRALVLFRQIHDDLGLVEE